MADEKHDEINWPLAVEIGRTIQVGEPFSSLSLREPTTTDVINFGVLDGSIRGDKWVDFVAELSGKSPPAIKAIPAVIVMRLIRQLQRFFEAAAA